MQDIIIVGDGGIGSNLGLPLIKLIAFHQKNRTIEDKVLITICDGDIVEEGNLIRQHFIPEDKGQKKATITADYLKSVALQLKADDIDVVAFPHYVKEDNIDIIKNKAIILVGVDNYITRRIIEDKAKRLTSVFVIFGGNEYDDGDVNVFHRHKRKNVTPPLTKKHPEVKERDEFPDEIPCEEAAVSAPQLILANMTVAGFMLEALNSYLTTRECKWHEKCFDLKTGNVHTEEIK